MNPPITTEVLDHGYVSLVDKMGDDWSIVRAARVSYANDPQLAPGEHYNEAYRPLDERARNLLRYLLKNRHTSPFEHVTFTFHVKAPIFVFRQWHRHRTWSFNEVSARYSVLPEEYYVPAIDKITTQSKANKQQRTDEQLPMAAYAQALIQETCSDAHRRYRMLLEAGCPRELARGVLPVNTYSEMFATVDLHNLLHFIKLRDHDHAQYEVQVYARAMLDMISTVVPVTIEQWEELGRP